MGRALYVPGVVLAGALVALAALGGCATPQDTGILDQDYDAGAEKVIIFVLEHSDLSRPTRARPTVFVGTGLEINIHVGKNAGAFYRYSTNVIVFRADWNAMNLIDRAFAVHEGVHYVELNQWPRRVFKCPKEREALAYRLMDEYLKENGSSLLKVGYSKEKIRNLTECGA